LFEKKKEEKNFASLCFDGKKLHKIKKRKSINENTYSFEASQKFNITSIRSSQTTYVYQIEKGRYIKFIIRIEDQKWNVFCHFHMNMD